MANELSSKQSHSFLKRAAVIFAALLATLLLTYLIEAAVVTGQYVPTMESLVGQVFANEERDLAFYFDTASTSMTIIAGQRCRCGTSIKENIVYVTNAQPDIYIELIVINKDTVFCNQYSQYLHLLEA